MKTNAIFSKKWICLLPGLILILSLSCTKDDLPTEDLGGFESPEETGPRDQPRPEYQDYYYRSY